MKDFKNIKLAYITRKNAKEVCEKKHYMKTYPQGAVINFGMVEDNNIVGVCVFGYSSSTTQKIEKVCYGLQKKEYIEMQRLWVSDDYGHNTESYILSKIIDKLKKEYNIKIIITHAGGCKDDCGIVYQASGWVYLGSSKCEDFYLTKKGEYKNIIAGMKYGRVEIKGKSKQEIGDALFGEGEIIKSHRYLYVYPLDKAIRRRLNKVSLPFPKTSKVFRKDQKFIYGDSEGVGCSNIQEGSTPSISKGEL